MGGGSRDDTEGALENVKSSTAIDHELCSAVPAHRARTPSKRSYTALLNVSSLCRMCSLYTLELTHRPRAHDIPQRHQASCQKLSEVSAILHLLYKNTQTRPTTCSKRLTTCSMQKHYREHFSEAFFTRTLASKPEGSNDDESTSPPRVFGCFCLRLKKEKIYIENLKKISYEPHRNLLVSSLIKNLLPFS